MFLASWYAWGSQSRRLGNLQTRPLALRYKDKVPRLCISPSRADCHIFPTSHDLSSLLAGDSQFPSRGEGRDVTRVQSFGCIKVVVDVTLQGMEELGYAVAQTQQSTVRLGLAS